MEEKMSRERMAKRGFTLVEIMIVVLILGILLGIAVPQWMRARESSQEKARNQNCRKIDDSKELWLMDNNLDRDAVPVMGDIVPTYLDVEPECPGGCTFEIGDGNTPCTFKF